MKTVEFGSFYVAVGGGLWGIIDTEGPDVGRFAGRGSLGFKALGMHAHLSGEWVQTEPCNLYFACLSVIIID